MGNSIAKICLIGLLLSNAAHAELPSFLRSAADSATQTAKATANKTLQAVKQSNDTQPTSSQSLASNQNTTVASQASESSDQKTNATSPAVENPAGGDSEYSCLHYMKTDASGRVFQNFCTQPLYLITHNRAPAPGQCLNRMLMTNGMKESVREGEHVCRGNLHYPDPGATRTSCDCPAGAELDIKSLAVTPAAKPAATDKELTQDRKDAEASCAANSRQAAFVNCGCLGEKIAAMRAGGETRIWQNLVEEAADQCPADKRTISDYIFVSCDGYMKDQRTDHTEFCRCSGDKVADSYIAQPAHKLASIENLRRQSLQRCGIADNSHRISP